MGDTTVWGHTTLCMHTDAQQVCNYKGAAALVYEYLVVLSTD